MEKPSLFEKILSFKGFDIQRALKDLNWTASLGAEEFYQWQENQKWKIVKYHYQNNPFFHSKVGNFVPELWEDLPILTKSDFQSDLTNLISKPFKKKDLYIANTSGSSGHPFFFSKDKYTHARTWAYIKRRYENLGLPLGSKEARFYGIPKEFKGYLIEKTKDILMNRVRFTVFDLSERVLNGFAEKFSNTRFDYIYGYTNSIVQFCRFLIRKNILLKSICPTLKLVIVTSEVCTSEDRKIIEEGTGVLVKNEYGASEAGYIAYECDLKRWHIAEENIYLETYKNNQILVTDLFNSSFPLIRYSIGDIGELSNEKCHCGSRNRILLNLEGRTNDMIILPSGKVSPGLTFYYISRSILESSGVLREFIIRQTALDTFIFDVVSDRHLTEDEEREIHRKIKLYLEPGLKLIINQVESIQRPPSGKIKHFYSEIKNDNVII